MTDLCAPENKKPETNVTLSPLPPDIDAAQLQALGAHLAEQPAPQPGTGDLWADIIARTEHPLLRALYEARRQQGIERYGTPLQRGNGRDFLSDALQEACDLVVYLEGTEHRSLVTRAEDILIAILARMDDVR